MREAPVESELVHRRLSELRATSGRLVLGILRHGEVDLGIGEDPQVEPDDLLIYVDAAPRDGGRIKKSPKDGAST
jgi:hypothetical protein